LLTAAGWSVQDFKAADIHAARGVAIREFVLDAGQGFADYLLYVDGKAAGVIEAKKHGATLTGVEIQLLRRRPGRNACEGWCSAGEALARARPRDDGWHGPRIEF
jgi:type I restriction enzyme R subunit